MVLTFWVWFSYVWGLVILTFGLSFVMFGGYFSLFWRLVLLTFVG